MAHVAKGSPLKATGMALGVCVSNNVIPSTLFDGQYWMIPDWSTLHPTASPGNAQVMCALDYTVPAIPFSFSFSILTSFLIIRTGSIDG